MNATTIERKAITIDQRGFAKEIEVYSNKIQAKQNIKKEVLKLIPKYRINESFYDNVMDNFYKALLHKYQKENTLNLKAEKLAELLELDLSNLKRFNEVYTKLRTVVSPSEETFTTYAETEEELTRLKQCEKLIETIYDVELKTGVKAYPFDVMKAFRRILNFNVRTNKYEANTYWVKTGKNI